MRRDETVRTVLRVCLVSSAGKYDAAQDAAAQHCAAREPDYSACVRPRCSASTTNLTTSLPFHAQSPEPQEIANVKQAVWDTCLNKLSESATTNARLAFMPFNTSSYTARPCPA